MQRLTTSVYLLYLQRRTPVALILVAVITVASVLDSTPLQISAGVALLGLIIQILFEINEKVTKRVDDVWYPTFQDALPRIRKEIDQKIHRGRVRIRWIGVTQEAGWPFSQNILLDSIAGTLGESNLIQIELALLDPDGGMCKRPDGPDRNQIRSTISKISNFIVEQSSQLKTKRCSVSVYLYDHRPTWHALLLDTDVLFYSTCMPANMPYASPQGGVEVVRANGGAPESERIRHFIAWFNKIDNEARASGKFVG
jgi:hypothetical protein